METNSLFAERWGRQWRQYSKYLRYVFNDHAVIALFFLLGAGLFAYQQLWQTTPVNLWTQGFLTIIIAATLWLFKRSASYLLPADAVFRLADEATIKRTWQKATFYSMVVNGGIELILILVLWPMMLRLYTTNLVILAALTLALVIIKMLISYLLAKRISQFPGIDAGAQLNWRAVITAEEQHRNQILGFFNMFIDVPGMRPTVKRRRWADALINRLPGVKRQAINRIIATSFVRQNSYFGVWGRLTVIGMLAAAFTQGWLQLFLLALLAYLMVIQVLPVMTSHRHLAFDHLFPISVNDRKRAFHQVMGPWLGLTVVTWVLIAIVSGQPLLAVAKTGLGLVLVGYLLLFWYVDKKLNALFNN